jgi:hypothetical protein
MRQLYVCSKALPNNHDPISRHRLIGVLRELKPGISPEQNGEYEFEYLISGKFHEYCLRLPDFPDPLKIYNNNETRSLLEKYLPVPGSRWFAKSLEVAGLLEYNEWEWLKHFGKQNPDKPYLCENLPESVIRYDK